MIHYIEKIAQCLLYFPLSSRPSPVRSGVGREQRARIVRRRGLADEVEAQEEAAEEPDLLHQRPDRQLGER